MGLLSGQRDGITLKIFIKISFTIIIWISFSYSQIASTSYLKDNVSLIYPSMEITKFNNPSEDYLFLDLMAGGIGNLLIIDNELTPVFYRKVNGIIYDFKFQPDGELTYGIGPTTIYGMDSSGTTINQFYAPPGIILDIHELRVLSDRTYYILGEERLIIDMSQYIQGGDTAALVFTNNVIHMDANDNEIWRWRTIDHYDILDVDQYVDLTQHLIDWTHCNSLEIDTDGNILLSTRNFDEVTKIDRTTGDIIWRLGGEKNQFTFINDTRGFSRQHCVRRLSNGNLIMFDNGVYLVPEYSSVVEYEIDETNFTATLVRRYTHNESVFSRIFGSVQELPNQHILIGWGESQNPAVTEINEQDSIEFEMKFISYARQYRAYRFKWETNLFTVSSDSIDFGIVSIGDSSLAELNLYNPKDSAITINECLINNNSFSVLNELPISIPSEGSVTLNVMFKPEAEGYCQDKLNVRSVTDTMLIGKQVYLIGATTFVSVEDRVNSPLQFSLSQNYPNPFNPVTILSWQLPEGSNVTLKIFDTLGEEVATLVNEYRPAGKYETEFNASSLPSGIYFYQLLVSDLQSKDGKAGDYTETKKMILLK
jgi:hypothetical protein